MSATLVALLLIGTTTIVISFVAGTLVVIPYDQWMKIDIGTGELKYKEWVGYAYFFFAPMFLLVLYYWLRFKSLDAGPSFIFGVSVTLWTLWGVTTTFFAAWVNKKHRLIKALNLLTSIAAGWVVGLASTAATKDWWKEVAKKLGDTRPGFDPLRDIAVVVAIVATPVLFWVALVRGYAETPDAGTSHAPETKTTGDESAHSKDAASHAFDAEGTTSDADTNGSEPASSEPNEVQE